jgi:uncharacterized protein
MARRSTGRLPWVLKLLGLVLTLLVLVPGAAQALEVPALRGHVNDEADLLSPAAEQALEQKLSAYESRSQHQFALLTVESLEGDSLEDFSIRVVEAWKLGKKGKDDGLLLLVVERDRKLRIEVGYGLEGDITDAISARVLRDVLRPAFRAGAPERGIEQAFDALIKKASGEAVPAVDSPPPQRAKRPSLGIVALLLMLLPFIIPLLIGRRLLAGGGRRGVWLGGMGGWGGGGWGGGGGGWGGGGGGWGGGGGGFGGGGASGSW